VSSTVAGDFLQLAGKRVLVLGVANRKSVAWHIARALEEQGATVLYSVRSEARRKSLAAHLTGKRVYVCDVEEEGAAARLAAQIAADFPAEAAPADSDAAESAPAAPRPAPLLHGVVHSIAFANYSEGLRPFHETRRADFLQATAISAFSLVELANALKPQLAPDASVVTIGISSLQVTPDNYGYMGPIKAALESSARFLAKSFSADTAVRFNVVGAGPLKTSASAGIPGYIESYLYTEKLTLRRRNLATAEVANAALFLLSPRSSGINATTLVVDAGLGSNFYDADLIRLAMRPESARDANHEGARPAV